jgi:hypothetical protein
MAARVVNPDEVNDIDTWLFNYKQQKRNIRQGSDGSMLVLDPVQMAEDFQSAMESAKKIPFKRGYDPIYVVSSASASAELRAAALAKLDEIKTTRNEAVEVATNEFNALERQLLEATGEWNIAQSPAIRKEKATLIASLTEQLSEADMNMRDAAYPHRILISDSTLPRKALNYASMDDRKVKYALHRTLQLQSTAQERAIAAE